MTDTPIKRGAARRLGLEQPLPPEPFSWDKLAVSMDTAMRNIRMGWKPKPGGIVIGPGTRLDAS